MGVLAPGARTQVSRWGRTFTAEVTETTEVDGSLVLRLVVRDGEPDPNEATQQPLLIFGHSMGKRSVAVSQVKNLLAEASQVAQPVDNGYTEENTAQIATTYKNK